MQLLHPEHSVYNQTCALALLRVLASARGEDCHIHLGSLGLVPALVRLISAPEDAGHPPQLRVAARKVLGRLSTEKETVTAVAAAGGYPLMAWALSYAQQRGGRQLLQRPPN